MRPGQTRKVLCVRPGLLSLRERVAEIIGAPELVVHYEDAPEIVVHYEAAALEVPIDIVFAVCDGTQSQRCLDAHGAERQRDKDL